MWTTWFVNPISGDSPGMTIQGGGGQNTWATNKGYMSIILSQISVIKSKCGLNIMRPHLENNIRKKFENWQSYYKFCLPYENMFWTQIALTWYFFEIWNSSFFNWARQRSASTW